ncbi:SUMF1/EgtB/PvdO family nonheme iron enzyme [uncultured Thiodictyon sp.]|uniref:SUMF1/EgtB/PvdO family nonheme iron enzyme n=1 Tax=uncultured Thiodictyon sp. TaxID=1846217 RepID=UPI0025CFFFCC|nr:SUMF1/EgtB/PvdO family nonheme iron enzyme [uncultured Thiodictyon sp.]
MDTGGGDFIGRDQITIHAPDTTPKQLLIAYYRDLAAECSRLPLGVVDPRFAQPGARTEVDLPSVYTDLHVVMVPREEGEDERRYGLRLARAELGERTALLDAVTGEQGGRLVLVGDAGSGKSTFVDYLTWRLASAVVDGTRSTLPPTLRTLLPVRLVLRRAAAAIPENGAVGDTLWRALEDDCVQRLGQSAAARLFPYLLERLHGQGALVLLDGLDEVPESGARRAHLLESVQRLTAALPAGSRVLLTARPYAYADPRWHLTGFHELALAPFDAAQVAGFIAHWYQAVRPVMGWDAPTAQQRGRALRDAINERAYLGDLASRPLLLTLMATLHSSWGQLPRDRADLYEESVKLLLTRWQTGREVAAPDGTILREPGIARALGLGEQRLRQALDRLAFATHEGQAVLPGRDEAPADIDRGQVIATFEQLCPQDLNPGVLLEYLETRAGLLIARREGVYAFPHRSFQEYLAACHLANTAPDFGAELRRRVWADPTWWREVYLLGVGKKRQGGLADAVNLVNTLVPASPADTDGIGERHWQAAVLAAKALLDLGFPSTAAGQEHFEAPLRRIRRWLVDLLGRGALPPKERLEAGDLLGLLGDPRPGVGTRTAATGACLPAIDWCEVPAGPFTLGSAADGTEADDDERPAHRVELPTFHIARYPVTNDQYRPFMVSGGYDQERWWTPEGWAWRQGATFDLSAITDEDIRKPYADWLAQRPQGRRDRPYWWDESPWNGANRPVVGISWHEALAYCRWLESQLRAKQPGVRVRLPSEAEWEKAARGTVARRWSWGDTWLDDRANTEAAGLQTTSPVGCFPAGASPCGALDLTGNVWEWTRSRWGSDILRPDFRYPYDPHDGRESLTGPDLRVVRGGSWDDHSRNARCAYRVRGVPDYFNRDVGFRLVLSLADSGF